MSCILWFLLLSVLLIKDDDRRRHDNLMMTITRHLVGQIYVQYLIKMPSRFSWTAWLWGWGLPFNTMFLGSPGIFHPKQDVDLSMYIAQWILWPTCRLSPVRHYSLLNKVSSALGWNSSWPSIWLMMTRHPPSWMFEGSIPHAWGPRYTYTPN